MISFISWVNDQAQYEGFKASAPGDGNEFIQVGQEVRSMASAYNEGMRRASGDILVFVHQDVRILDPDFRSAVTNACMSYGSGFVGVIGSTEIGKPSWWDTPPESHVGMVVQGQEIGHANYRLNMFRRNDCVCRQLDGLLLATRRRDFVWPEWLPGIHFVDLAACRMMEEAGYENRVFRTLLQHLSQGEVSSESFAYNRRLYEQRWPA